MKLTEESIAEIYSHLMDDGITVKAGTSQERIEEFRALNEEERKLYGYPVYNLTVAEGKDAGEDPNTGLAAKLPKDKEIRETLLARLRGRFGTERVAAMGDVVLIVDKKKDLGDWTDAPKCACTLMLEDAGVMSSCDDRFNFSKLSFNQEKIARFVLEKPTRVKLKGENDFVASRRVSVGEFVVSGKDGTWIETRNGRVGKFGVDGWVVSYEGFVPAK